MLNAADDHAELQTGAHLGERDRAGGGRAGGDGRAGVLDRTQVLRPAEIADLLALAVDEGAGILQNRGPEYTCAAVTDAPAAQSISSGSVQSPGKCSCAMSG